jgi:hypothetical protein
MEDKKENELQDELKYDTVEDGKLEEGREGLTSCMNPPHYNIGSAKMLATNPTDLGPRILWPRRTATMP